MYPFAGLPENLAAFCDVLRRAHGFRVGPGELHDAARALEVVDLLDEAAVRHALRPVLSGTRREVLAFDRAFTQFFFPGPAGVRQSDQMPPIDPGAEPAPAPRDERTPRPTARAGFDAADDVAAADRAREPSPEATDDEPAGAESAMRSSYSPLDAEAADGPVLAQVDPEWRNAARSMVRRLRIGLSRRWRPARRGRRFDLRRTLRASLQTGGEALAARWQQRPRRTPRFVLLIDGSRSMDGAAQTALQMAVATASVSRRVEVFIFSTSLQRVTADVRRTAVSHLARSVSSLPHAWGGGTSIGTCLRAFLREYGDRLVGRDTIVLVASDGLDVGDLEVLRDAMRELRRRSAAVVWVNPLLDTPGYAPTASGMRVARPYVTTFAAVRDAAGLVRLSRQIGVRPA